MAAEKPLKSDVHMKKIIGIGNALVDIMVSLKNDDILSALGFPKGSMILVSAEESAEIRKMTYDLEKYLAPGGSVANTMHGLGIMGVPSGFIGAIGHDETGTFFNDEMRRAGCSTILKKKDIDTGTSVAMISPDAERTFATYLGAAVELVAEDITSALFKGYDYLYVEGYLINSPDLVEKCCSKAREAGISIVIDLSSFNVVEAYRDDFTRVVKEYVDILFANEEEARALTDKEGKDALEELGTISDIVILKRGGEGSIVKMGEEVYEIDPINAICRDTTGAGDLYATGFLYGLASGFSADKCGAMGSILSGKVIEVVGAKMDSDRWDQAKKMIESLF